MALTDEEKSELIYDVINEITTQSTSIDELPQVSNLNQADSLPAYETGSTNLVRVPIPLISKPAVDAAEAANRAANAATSAAEQATLAKQEADQARDEAQEATKEAEDATAKLILAYDTIKGIKDTADRADTLSKKLEGQLNGYTITVSTESEYNELSQKGDNTLYFCTEDETV